MIIIINTLVKLNSTKEIQKLLDESLIDEDRLYNIDSRHINHYISLFTETIFKLNQFIEKHTIRAGPFYGHHTIPAAISFLKNYKNGYAGFSVYYYETEGGYEKNAWFLYGRPYQTYSF